MYRDLPARHTNRLPGFDYSSCNLYFVTICTTNRENIFIEADHNQPANMELSEIGNIVEQHWKDIPHHYPHVSLDQYIIMPNHIHGIITMNNGRENRAPTLGQIIAYFKYKTTKEYNMLGAGVSHPQIKKLWQRNYYEHIVRDQIDLDRIRAYIHDNPSSWVKHALFM